MGLGDILSSGGGGGLGAIDLQALGGKLLNFGIIFLLLIVLGGVVMALFVVKSRNKKKGEKYKVGWWLEVGERLEANYVMEVEEIRVPGTSLRIFYNKEKDMWLPRFTRGVKNNLFYVLLTPTGQMVNFTLKSLTADLRSANLEYDHTDMLWAAENSREYIKRNYQDKAVKWWQLYQNTIATAAMILIMTFSFILIIYFLRGVVQDIGAIASQMGDYAKQACMNSQSSGVVGAT